MGYWGSELLENDAAADAVGFWNEFIEHGRTEDPAFWTSERIYALLRQSYLRTPTDSDLKDVDRASEILAMGVKFLEAELTIPYGLSDLLARTASVQLERTQLREWGSDARHRRAALESLLTSISRTALPKSSGIDPDKVEAKQWRAWSKDYPRWVHSAIALVADEKWDERTTPPLIRRLEAIVRYSQGRKELGQASAELTKYRLMAMAYSLGVHLELPESEVLHLIALAEEQKGELYRRHYWLNREAIPTLRDKLLGAQSEPS